jgi:hypothetical protein
MKIISAARAFGAAFAFVLLGAIAQHALAVLPTPLTGPSMGDQNTNIFTLQQAVTFNNQNGFSAALTANNANSQSTCTALTNPLNLVTTSTSTGSLCLPTAVAGRIVMIGNGTSNGLNLFGSNTTFVVGTQDTINGTTGSTANTTVLPSASSTANKNAFCFSPANGAWNCNVATGP